jgi:hypothetical protein
VKISSLFHFPQVPTSAVTLLLRCGTSVGMQNSAHYLHAAELLRRLHLLLDRVKLLDDSSNEFIVKVKKLCCMQRQPWQIIIHSVRAGSGGCKAARRSP